MNRFLVIQAEEILTYGCRKKNNLKTFLAWNIDGDSVDDKKNNYEKVGFFRFSKTYAYRWNDEIW